MVLVENLFCNIITICERFKKMKKLLILLGLVFWASSSCARVQESSFLFNDKRTLYAFYIGDKLCDRRENRLWDDACQDFVFEDVFGKEWRQIKKMLFAFQKAVAERDPKYLKKYLTKPLEVYFDYGFRNEEEQEAYKATVNDLSELKNILDKLPKNLIQRIQSKAYKDVYAEGFSGWINVGDDISASLILDVSSHKYNITSHYIPKIRTISFDFGDYAYK